MKNKKNNNKALSNNTKKFDNVLDLTACNTREEVLETIEKDIAERAIIEDAKEAVVESNWLVKTFKAIKKAFHIA